MPEIITPGSNIDLTLWDTVGPIPKSAALSPEGAAGVKERLAGPAKSEIEAIKGTLNTLTPQAIGSTAARIGLLGYGDGRGKEIRCLVNQAAPPTQGDDALDGFSPLSLWVTVTNQVFICLSDAAGAAVWAQINGGGGAVNELTPIKLVQPETNFAVLPTSAQTEDTLYSVEAWHSASPGIGLRGLARVVDGERQLYLYENYGTEYMMADTATDDVPSGSLGIGWALTGDLAIKHGEATNVDVSYKLSVYTGAGLMEQPYVNLNPGAPAVALPSSSQPLGSRHLIEIFSDDALSALVGTAVLTVRGDGSRTLKPDPATKALVGGFNTDPGIIGIGMNGDDVVFVHGESTTRNLLAIATQYQL